MPSILSDLFGGLGSTEGYTLGELMNIDPGRIERGDACSVQLINTYHEIRKASLLDKFRSFFGGKSLVNMYYLIFVFKVSSAKGHTYQVIIRCSPDFDLSRWTYNRVQVYCSCFDFKFKAAYGLAKANSLFLTDRTKLELGEAITKAPKAGTRTSLLCKHAFAACQYLINNYSSLMRSV